MASVATGSNGPEQSRSHEHLNVSSVLEQSRSRVRLNVGGTKFETSRSTLTRYPDSMLGVMFSGREGIQVPLDDEGCVALAGALETALPNR